MAVYKQISQAGHRFCQVRIPLNTFPPVEAQFIRDLHIWYPKKCPAWSIFPTLKKPLLHGQFTTEALSSQKARDGMPFIGTSGYLMLANTTEANAGNINWRLAVKNLKRRMEALVYFGAFWNFDFDQEIMQMITKEHVKSEWYALC